MTDCMGITRLGAKCKLEGVDRGGGWYGCGYHPEDPEDSAGSNARQFIGEAMDHASWEEVPVEIQQLIESAWIQSEREGWGSI